MFFHISMFCVKSSGTVYKVRHFFDFLHKAIKSKKFITKQENEVDRLVKKWLAKAGIEIG